MTKPKPTPAKAATPKNIHVALLAAQSEMEPAIKSAENETFQNTYADLSAVVRACRSALNKNGIAFFHVATKDGAEHGMRTTLFHADSATALECDVPLILSRRDMQAYKSATTYAKRIGLESLTGIAPEDDDDGNAASGRDKPDPRQQRREAASEAARTQPAAKYSDRAGTEGHPEEIPPAHPNARWQDTVCHVGKAGGEMKGKTLAELTEKHLKYLAFEWNPKKPTPADTALAAAVKLALAEVKQGPELPMDSAPPAETPAADDNLDMAPAPAKEEAQAETAPPVIDWRPVKAHSIGKKLGGKTLGELADAKAGDILPELDGAAILRRLSSEAGVTMITGECKDDGKRDELIAAIRAAVAETKPYDQPEWLESMDEDGLREEVSRRIAELGVTAEAADKTLDESGLEPVAKSGEAGLRHIIKEWETVSAALKEGE